MSYSLEQFVTDCREALTADSGPGGRERVRQCVSRACNDAGFVAAHLGDDNTSERKVLYEDPDLGFCILAHVYDDARASDPHDHAGTWAVNGQARGITTMTDWEVVEAPAGDTPGTVKELRRYRLEPGDAHVYQETDLHSPGRDGPTRLIRIEGTNMDEVERDKYEAV